MLLNLILSEYYVIVIKMQMMHEGLSELYRIDNTEFFSKYIK